MPKRVLVVDDDPAQRRLLEEAIKRFGSHVSTAESADKALAAPKADTAGDSCLVLLDLVMPGTDGLAVLSAMRTLPRKPPAIVQTAHGSIDAAITAMRAGAVDFVVKPVSPERLAGSIKNAPQNGGAGGRVIPHKSCAIPENLVESILFGHEKGSFTGASEKRTGKFLEADHGTLFLDEIGELPLDAQVKLLRALQDGEIDPVGARHKVKVDFRLISATNQNLIALVNDGRFREDLYYRLNVFPIC